MALSVTSMVITSQGVPTWRSWMSHQPMPRRSKMRLKPATSPASLAFTKANLTRLRKSGSGSPLKRVMSRSQASSASRDSEQVSGSCWASGSSSQPLTRCQKALIPWARNPGSAWAGLMVTPSSHQGALASGSVGACRSCVSGVGLVMQGHLQRAQPGDGQPRQDVTLAKVQALQLRELAV
ncbi:hypothetical protein D3C79_791490 [compost metagenome]